MNTNVFEKYESEVRSYCRKFPSVFIRAKGTKIYDENNKEYLDFFCGAGTVNYGHNNDYIKERVIDYLKDDGVIHSLDMYTASKGDFIRFFEEKVLIPKGLDYKIMFTGPTGANANEAALKLARKVTGRTNVFALMGGFHGMTLGALAATTEKSGRQGGGVPLNYVTHIPTPYMFPGLDTIEYMERLIKDDHSGVDKPAALIIEAVQAEGGIYVFSNEWLRQVRDFCTNNDILLIMDEVQIGNCRTGKFFAFERAGIKPDIVTVAKSIGGMGMPFALTLFRPELDIWQPGEHNGTFRGFQLATVAGKAGLEYMLENRVESQVQEKSKIVNEYLKTELPKISDLLCYRGIGLIWGIDFNKYPEDTAKKVSAECFNNGLIIELAGRKDCVLKLMPPLIISDTELINGLNIICKSIKQVLEK